MIGASTDERDVNADFAEKAGLHFPLISDEGGPASREIGILSDGGRAARTTFLIDRTGKVAKIFTDVQVDGHAEAVLAAAQEMQSK